MAPALASSRVLFNIIGPPIIGQNATLGITAESAFRVPIDEQASDLDVGLSRPVAVGGHEGRIVHPVMRYMS